MTKRVHVVIETYAFTNTSLAKLFTVRNIAMNRNKIRATMSSDKASVSRDGRLEKMAQNNVAISPPDNFDFINPELWPFWKNRFERYLRLANLSGKTDSEKIDILCYTMGEQSEPILAQVVPNTGDKSLADVLQAFTNHFCPKKNVILARYRLNMRFQQTDESVYQFITALHTLAEHCHYGMIKNELIRDRIVVGLSDKGISEKLLLESSLTLEKATTMARQTEVSLPKHDFIDLVSEEADDTTKPSGLESSANKIEENVKTKALYKKVQKMLDKIGSAEFEKSVQTVKALPIDSEEKLEGVLELIFKKAVNPSEDWLVYALICKELSTIQVSGPGGRTGTLESVFNFKKCIVRRSEMEFEKYILDNDTRAIKMKEIKSGSDPKKKKELQLALTKEERQIRIKSFCNIRFIGDLFDLGMLTTNIMHRCIGYLLHKFDEKSLECLWKLLRITGRNLESKNQSLEPYFEKMLDIVNRKVTIKVSSWICSMLQDLIELRMNKWIPREDHRHFRTINQIQKETETERLNTPLNNTSVNTPRNNKRNKNNTRDRSRGRIDTQGWSKLNFNGHPSSPSTLDPGYFQTPQKPRSNLHWAEPGFMEWETFFGGHPSAGSQNATYAQENNIPQPFLESQPPPLMSLRLNGPGLNKEERKRSQDTRNIAATRSRRPKKFKGLSETSD